MGDKTAAGTIGERETKIAIRPKKTWKAIEW